MDNKKLKNKRVFLRTAAIKVNIIKIKLLEIICEIYRYTHTHTTKY